MYKVLRLTCGYKALRAATLLEVAKSLAAPLLWSKALRLHVSLGLGEEHLVAKAPKCAPRTGQEGRDPAHGELPVLNGKLLRLLHDDPIPVVLLQLPYDPHHGSRSRRRWPLLLPEEMAVLSSIPRSFSDSAP